ncbi:MAG: T9SS type A sorting domain-containing protein [Salibacteraceae bacterium]
MLRIFTIALAVHIFPVYLFSQTPNAKSTLSITQGTYLGISHLQGTEVDFSNTGYASVYGEINNFNDRNRYSPIERNTNPKVDPLWDPNYLEKSYSKSPQTTLLNNFAGIEFTNVNPPDPCVAAGPNHVIQMVNGGGGAVYKIFDKNGVALTGNVNFDNLFAGYSGLGDPIVMFDQLSNRWFLSEFSSSGNKLLIAISLTDDPTGNFHTYVFQATNFPDYPKYSVWPDAYYCTANENTSSIYAFERDSMLVGAPARLIRNTVNDLSGFGFQTLTPVNFEGTTLPNTPTNATFWRHVDDEAHFQNNADPFNDYVEYWQFVPDFESVSNSQFFGSEKITVADFDSDLNGYRAFSAIVQPNSNVRLDPLREVFMNRMAYRNFDSYETIVACHVTDVDGNDRAGMRWYEFRKNDTIDWYLFQQGTYSPTEDSRWMGAIEMNENGSICLAYSVSSSSIYPSLRYTGRNINDPAGVMTLPEQTIVNGQGSNFSNRYGDYAAMTIDPSNDSTFWFTGEFNTSSSWSTQVAEIALTDSCHGLTAVTNTYGDFTCPGETNGTIEVFGVNGSTNNYTFSIDSGVFQTNNIFQNLAPGWHYLQVNDGNCVSNVPAYINGPDTFTVIDSVKQITCYGDTDGYIEFIVGGGTGDIQYSLDSVTWTNSGRYNNLTSGEYTVYVKDDSNCTLVNEPITIVEPDELICTYDIDHPTTNTSLDAGFTVLAAGGTNPKRYSLDDVNYQADSTFSNLISGTYWIYTRDNHDCFVAERINVNLVGVNEVLKENDFLIYPNPTSGIFQVALGKSVSSKKSTITLLDIHGKIIELKEIPENAINTNIEFDLTPYAKGIYVINIQYGSEIISTQVIFE